MDRLRAFGFLLKDVTRLYVQRFEQRARRFGVTLLNARRSAIFQERGNQPGSPRRLRRPTD